MNPPEILRFDGTDTLVDAVSRRWLDTVAADLASSGAHRVALPGGRVAGRFMAAAAAGAKVRGQSWDGVAFFWGDERCVPPDHADSNYRLAAENLLTPAAIVASQCHRLRGELPPADAARLASAELRALLPSNADGVPVLDLVFLGMGEDGHVASLFPGAPDAVVHSREPVLDVIGPKPPPQRLTLGFTVLAAAREVWVLASGAGKEEALRLSLASGLQTPLARLLSLRPQTRIFTDIAGA
jgi:6-phosphogluconolactonase